ncbi:uncharacterized protein A1O9_12576 [Exophiala aquamarina CBS 119918]|uniref:Uncharacterized protein n=1 Tax=Exophiala aquamarina CBS 119918 TaxID=1182545 RepID=A0A072NVK6_9EURO|nr:uncharacterized protein A1O9_12576 [Exophiala aquamarina CBS 119918]KEF51427.1 hypothetical protein A1O9_12576 [Exophiala aquamarina CBS 119918]
MPAPGPRIPVPNAKLQQQRNILRKLDDERLSRLRDLKSIEERISRKTQKLEDIEFPYHQDAEHLPERINQLRMAEDYPEIEDHGSVPLKYAPGDKRFKPYFVEKYQVPSRNNDLARMVDIDVQDFMERELDTGDDLWDLVVVSGLTSSPLSRNQPPPLAVTVGEYFCGNLVDPKSVVEHNKLPDPGTTAHNSFKDKRKKSWTVTPENQWTDTCTLQDFDKSPRSAPYWECIISGIEYEVVETGGVVLYGQKLVVYAVLRENNYVQCHFIPCEDTSVIRNTQWDTQSFSGPLSEPEIILGSDCVDFSSLKLSYSSAQPMKQMLIKDSITIGGAISLPKVLTLNGAYNFKIAKTRKNLYMKNFEGNLHRLINSPVILYSPAEKRAWMVSFVSVALHVAPHRAWLQRELEFRIPRCASTADGGRAAFRTIRDNYKSPLKAPMENEELSEDERSLTIRDYMEDVLASLDVARRESFRARGIFRERILGFELADIVKMKEHITMRRRNLDAVATGWAPLLDAVSIVLFYDGLSDPIVPSTRSQHSQEISGYCGQTMWRSVPEGYNILTASWPCLDYMSEHLNRGPNIRRLIYDYCWRAPNRRLFDLCTRQRHHICNRLQELRPDGLDIASPTLTDENRRTAAVAFKFSTDVQTIQDNQSSVEVDPNPTPLAAPPRTPPTPAAPVQNPGTGGIDGALLDPPDNLRLGRPHLGRQGLLRDVPVAAVRAESRPNELGGQLHRGGHHNVTSRRPRSTNQEHRRGERRTVRSGNVRAGLVRVHVSIASDYQVTNAVIVPAKKSIN